MPEKPQVSIVCPLYNKKDFIIASIESVLSQEVTNWEMIIVDDGSTDGSFELVAKNIYGDKRIKLIRRSDISQNKGASVCRNIGIEYATGDFIMFLDADDLMMKECLLQRIRYANKYPNYSWYIFKVRKYKGGQVLKERRIFERVELFLNRDKRKFFLKKFLVFDLPWHTSSTFWRKKLLLNIEGFNENFQRLQDPEIHIRALLRRDFSFKYSQNRYDFLHRIDEDRVDWMPYMHVTKRINAYRDFIDFFVPFLYHNESSGFIKYLQGYLLASELLYKKFKMKLSEKEISLINNNFDLLYSNCNVRKIRTKRYESFVSYWKKVEAKTILTKLKYPSIIIILYKKFFI